MKTHTFLLLSIILFQNASCVKPQTYLQAYYNFRGDDFDKLLDFELGQEISFQNNLGETLNFQVESTNDDYKKQYQTGGGSLLGVPVPVSYLFYYDEQITDFLVNPRIYKMRYRFIRYPLDEEQAMNKPHSEFSSKFIASVSMIGWNGAETWDGYGIEGIVVNFEDMGVEMTINNITYSNVYILESGNSNPLINGVIVRKINRIYYDKQHGIIGFDETDGIQWRLMN
jgi:hypothetical protein